MAKTMKKNGGTSKITVGVGIGMLAALSAGAYYMYGTKEGAKRRVKIRGWVLKAKGEVMEKLENLKEVNEKTYRAVVSEVMKKYQSVKSIDKKDVDSLIVDLKKHWSNIKKHLDSVDSKTHKVKISIANKK